jgi:hypothetical protein
MTTTTTTTTTDLAISLQVDQTPQKIFKAINDVGAWWTEIEGSSRNPGDVFMVRFGNVYITHKIAELVPYKRIVWHVTDSSEKEWIDTKICFDIAVRDNLSEINFTHLGMVPGLEDYNECVKGWTKFIKGNLPDLIGKTTVTIEEMMARYKELAAQELWFDIQDELFAGNIKSMDPAHSPYMGYAEGKAAVRKKGEDFVARIEVFHGAHTTDPVVGGPGGNHFAVGRSMDATLQGFGRIKMEEIMLYEVRDGEIVSEQFFY